MVEERKAASGASKAVNDGEELLALDDAAQFLGISKPTLYRLLGQGDVKGVKVGRQWRFRKADLRAYMEREPVAVAAPPADVLDAELDFFAGELRRAGKTVPEESGKDAASGERKIAFLAGYICSLAISAGASDIHLEPQRHGGETHLRLRLRIDGLLHEVRRLPIRLHEALVLRYKEMAAMNAAERRLPQDGRIPIRVVGKDFDLRVSCVPSLSGESLVMRILDKSSVLLGLNKLGLAPEDQAQIESWSSQPNGVIVATGATGTGKTTVLYSILHKINDAGKKIITIEDPIEYQLGGIVQIGVNKKAGLGFGNALRAAFRHNPDIVMVGETSDAGVARMVHEGAITGLLVLTTLNAYTAAEAVRSLVDMGVEPFLVSKTLVGITAQRLARRICKSCKEPVDVPPSDPTLAHIRQLAAEGEYVVPESAVFHRGRGCGQCRNTGYRGRIGLFEVMTFAPPLAEALLRGASAEEIEGVAVEHGMRTLLADGIRKAVEGITTFEEALRAATVSL